MTSPTPWLVGIGASAGGFTPLRSIIADLPGGLPAAFFVVVHLRAAAESTLTAQLRRGAAMPVVTARHGLDIEAGTVYVAPPDRHLAVADGRLCVERGPTENGHRPAVDVLFRSMARAGGPSVVATVLSGALDDGAAGARAVADEGGAVLVQDPAEAVVSSMPHHAIEAVPDAVALPSEQIAAWIVERLSGPMAEPARRRGAIDAARDESPHDADPPALACPSCGGVLLAEHDARPLRFVCRVGHRWSEGALSEAQDHELERALWSALRIVEEQLSLDRALLTRARAADRHDQAARLQRRIEEHEQAHGVLTAALDEPAAADHAGHPGR